MKILLKYIVRNIVGKKLRSILILASIALTTALFFASLTITDTIGDLNLSMFRSMVGNSDIRVFPKESKEGSPFITLSGIKGLSDKTEYAVGIINGSAIFTPTAEDMLYTNVIGTTMQDLSIHNPVSLTESTKELEQNVFEGNQVIISNRLAKKYGISLGSVMELEFGDHREKFSVCGIARQEGLFMAEGIATTLIIPKKTLAGIYGLSEEVNDIYIKVKNTAAKETLIKELTPLYPDCEVTESLDSSDLSQSMTEIQMPLKMVTILVIIMSIYIIFTSFKIISLERLPNIGTFRSIGATKKIARWMLRLESLVFGIVGGLVGMGLGTLVLRLILKIMSTDVSDHMPIKPDYPPVYLLETFLFAVILSFISAIIPIRGVFKIPTKELILNQRNNKSKRNRFLTILAFLLLAASILIPEMIKGSSLLTLMIDNVSVMMILISLLILLPIFVRLLSPILEKVFSIGGQDGAYAAKNLKNNKSIINIIGLLTIGISTLILISSINKSLIDEILNVFQNTAKYDIHLSLRQADENTVNELLNMDGITEASGSIQMNDLETLEGININRIYGIDSEKFLNHWDFDIRGTSLSKLKEGRNIILGSTVLDKMGLTVGDDITLKFEKSMKRYHIIDSVDTPWCNGNLGFVASENLSLDGGLAYDTDIYIKTDQSPEEIRENLEKKYLKDLSYNKTKSEEQDANTEGINRVFSILKSYSQLTMLIGIIGIVNNLLVSFLERKRSFAVYRSVGMSRRQLKKMILLEAVSGGMIGGIFGLIAAALMLRIMPDVMKQISVPVDMTYSIPLFTGYFLAAVLIMVIASLVPAVKSKRISIIETIKYE